MMDKLALSTSNKSRDNNFNFIRVLSALVILFYHSFVLATGKSFSFPFQDFFGLTFDAIAVDVFFLISGFLVTASLLNRQKVLEFSWARILRIYPALMVVVLLSVFVLGPYFSTLSFLSYFSHKSAYVYLAKCSTLFAGLSYVLPEVFNENPYKNAINGSLWTLTYEVRLYFSLAILWLISNQFKRHSFAAFKLIILVLTAILGGILFRDLLLSSISENYIRLPYMFFAGSTYFIFKNRILLSFPFLISIVALLIGVGAISFQTENYRYFCPVYLISVGYILFYVAFIPGGIVRKYNSLGDYSYGIYIYAFPVQQSIAALIPDISIFNMLLVSFFVTFLLSIISWHTLEKRALKLKTMKSTKNR